MKVNLYLTLILILASCVAINHGLKCLVCTSVEHGVDCDKNPANFSVECPENNNVCQMSGKLGSIGRSCSQSDNEGGVDHKALDTKCTPNADGSCSCNTDNCNDTPGGPDDPDDGDKSSTAGSGNPGGPGGDGTTVGGGDPKNDPTKGPSGPEGPADPSSAQSNKNFNLFFFCLLFITIRHLY